MRARLWVHAPLVVGLMLAPTALAGEPAPVPSGFQAPKTTVEITTAWEAPLSTVSRFFTDPGSVSKQELTESLGAKEKASGTLVTLSDRFLFDFGSSDLAPTAAASLDSVVALMVGTAGTVTVTGHTDNIGGDAVNQPLSEKRAEAVKTYLVSKGIDTARITANGKGSKEPVADNETDGHDNPEGRQQNRRVEILFKQS